MIGLQEETAATRARLEMLEDSIARFRRASDLDGLIRMRDEASRLAGSTQGRSRRKAERMARKAGAAINGLRKNGLETVAEREEREARLERETRRLEDLSIAALKKRFETALPLLLDDTVDADASVTALRTLVTSRADGPNRIAFPASVEAWWPSLVRGFDGSQAIFAGFDWSDLAAERTRVDRTLRSIAVELMSGGAEVTALSSDVLPLVAYCLFNDRLPILAEADAPETADRVNRLLLAAAGEVTAMDAPSRPLFLGLLRLAVLLGEAQAYANALELGELSPAM
jgi:hypothetical protein